MALIRLTRRLADTVVIKFHEIRQVITGPPAWGDTAFASPVEAVRETEFQSGRLRCVGNFLDAEGKSMEIEQ